MPRFQTKPMRLPQQGGPQKPGFAAKPGIGASPTSSIDGAIQGQMQNFLTGGMQKPPGISFRPQRVQAMNAPPAWQQLQQMGMGGQGSAQANREMLAKAQAGGGGGPVAQYQPGGGAGYAGFPKPPGGGGMAYEAPPQSPGPQQGAMEAAQGGPLTATPSFGGANPAIHQELLKQAFKGGGGYGPRGPW